MDRGISRVHNASSTEDAPPSDPQSLMKHGKLQIGQLWQFLWTHREDESLLHEAVRIALSQPVSRTVCDEFEFYIPQFIQLLIMVERDWELPALEQLVYFFCQHSLHTALLCYLNLFAYVQDLNPELSNGAQNQAFSGNKDSQEAYERALKFMYRIERVVLLTNDAKKFEKAYHDKELSREEFLESRREYHVTEAENFAFIVEQPRFKGALPHKRKKLNQKERLLDKAKSSMKWQERYIEIKFNHLLFYDIETNNLVRSIPLLPHLRRMPLSVNAEEATKIEHYFHLIDENTDGRPEILELKAPNATAKKRWVKAIIKAMDPGTVDHTLDHRLKADADSDSSPKADVSPTEKQLQRLLFLRDQFHFLQMLVNVRGAKLREVAAKVPITLPEPCYMPMCYSSEEFIVMTDIDMEKTKTFDHATDALVVFNTQTVDNGHVADAENTELMKDFQVFDVANVLHDEFSEVAPSTVMETVTHVLAPVAKRFLGKRRAENMLLTRPNIWASSETLGSEGIVEPHDYVSLARKNLPSTDDELFVFIQVEDIHIRQEMFATQVSHLISNHWKEFEYNASIMNSLPDDTPATEEGLTQEITVNRPCLLVFRLLPVNNEMGFKQAFLGAKSLEGIKKQYLRTEIEEISLLEHFRRTYPSSPEAAYKAGKVNLSTSQKNFVTSLAGCSVFAYVMDLRDQHLNNILIAKDGQVILSNFSYIFGDNSSLKGTVSGGFRITKEMEDLLNFTVTAEGSAFDLFIDTCVTGFLSLTDQRTLAEGENENHIVESVLNMLEVMSTGANCGGVNYLVAHDVRKIGKDLQIRFGLDVKRPEAVGRFLVALEKMFVRKGQKLRQRYGQKYS